MGGAGLAAWTTHAQDRPKLSYEQPDLITPEAQSVINSGLAYLNNSQSNDGSYVDQNLGSGNVAITGLAGLAMLAGGHQPGRGRYGDTVARAAKFVANVRNPGDNRYLNYADHGHPSHNGMYQHGFGTLFLSEVYGTVSNPELHVNLRRKLEQAVQLIVDSQNKEGGWRYEPRPVNQADVSVTVAQLMALRAARNAGLYVPKNVVDKCVDYIKSCQQQDGGFCYIRGINFSRTSAFARSAAAVVGLFSAGVYEGKEIERGLNYLMRFVPGRRYSARDVRPEHYYYGHYYAALAMWTAGGNYWSEWFPAIRDELISKANLSPGRVWSDYHGSAYATAMACIVLQLPNNYLPIMQK